jgi:hypothetical protein
MIKKNSPTSEKVYELLVGLYPEEYLKRYEQHMLYLFRDMYRAAYKEKGFMGVALLWLEILRDICITIPREYMDTEKRKRSMFDFHWKAALLGSLLLLIPLYFLVVFPTVSLSNYFIINPWVITGALFITIFANLLVQLKFSLNVAEKRMNLKFAFGGINMLVVLAGVVVALVILAHLLIENYA